MCCSPYLQGHSGPSPNDVSVVELVPDVAVGSRSAVQMLPGDAQRCDQHGDAAQEKDGAGDGEETTHQNKSG